MVVKSVKREVNLVLVIWELDLRSVWILVGAATGTARFLSVEIDSRWWDVENIRHKFSFTSASC